jgi:hypothetical protein
MEWRRAGGMRRQRWETEAMRMLGIGLAVLLGTGLIAQGALRGEAAEKIVQKKTGKAGYGFHSGGTLGVRGDGSVQMSKGKKAGGLKTKGSAEGAKGRKVIDCEGYAYTSQQLMSTSCGGK